MNKLFRKLPLPAKLLVVAILPLLFLSYLFITVYNSKKEKIRNLESYQKRIDVSSRISVLISELQVERRYAFGYYIQKKYYNTWLLQRPKTDQAYEELRRINYRALTGFEDYTLYNRLRKIRELVDEQAISPDRLLIYYTNVIVRLSDLNQISIDSLSYSENVDKEYEGQILLSKMSTYLGLLRANLYYTFLSQNSVDTLTQLQGLYDLYESFQTEFLLKSTPASINRFNHLRDTGSLKFTLDNLNKLFRNAQGSTGLNAQEWWDTSTKGVDELRQLQNSMLVNLKSVVDRNYQAEIKKRDYSLIVLVVILVTVLIIMMYTLSVITKMLTELKEGAQVISLGGTGVHFDIESRDVIGSLADSILKIDATNKALADAAELIGKGDLEVVVTPRSEDDILGNSIKKMKRALREYNSENKKKLWIHEGLETINQSIAGEKKVRQLCNNVLQALISYLQCESGVFYSFAEQVLHYVGGYAVADVNRIPQEIALGETLIGQAALNRKITYLTHIPDDVSPVKTGTTASLPKVVVIIPLVHDDVLEGVIEIMSISELDDLKLSLVEQCTPVITVALQTAKNRERLQELLEETQAQGEELLSQHNELENLNTELEAQAQKLQASEEELRVQQEELLQTNQELEERSRLLEERNELIVERNEEIQKKARELEQSSKYKSEFLANMSHELRTPLNSILLLSRLLSDNHSNNLSPDQIEYARVIQSSGNGLLRLIDEILDLSRIESGKMELDITPVAIAAVLDDLKAMFNPVAVEKDLFFEVEVGEDVPQEFKTDRLRLEQILKNLVANALKFTIHGSVSLNVYRLEDSQIAFSVKDTGIGIAEEKQQLIFDAFRQEDGSTRRRFGGTGLGLSISRELARLLGGEIKLKSKQGEGSEFTVCLPVDGVQEKTAVHQHNEIVFFGQPDQKDKLTIPLNATFQDDRDNIETGDKIILIVEDDLIFAKTLLNYTRKKGYKAIIALKGDEALDLAKYYHPVGILLDINLPVKDGWEVMEDLKNTSFTRNIPVHMMSSNEAKKESIQKGAVDFINKPAVLEQMPEVFRNIERILSDSDKKVLIVEENTVHAKALAYFLETFNITSEIKDTVKQGIISLQKHDINCVILNMGSPDNKAYDTLPEVKKTPGLENLAIILFTGKHLSVAEEQRMKQYADSIVVKTAYSYQRILDEVSLFLHLVGIEQRKESNVNQSKKLKELTNVLNGKTILIADDDVRNIFSLTKALEKYEMNVLSAMDGKEALDILQEHEKVDVVLMDIMMPLMDGYEAIRRIRQQHKYRNLPVIAITAKAMSGDREKCIKAGASDYISKPVDIDQLLSLLRVWLFESRA